MSLRILHTADNHIGISFAQYPDAVRDAIHHLRSLHRDLDQAVLTAYAWQQPGPDGPAIELGHDFHQVETLPENDRTHYTHQPPKPQRAKIEDKLL
jgi:hypothetical protein